MLAVTQNPMVGDGGVRDVRGTEARHVAVDATVLRGFARRQRQAASPLLVALQAASAVMGVSLVKQHALVGIVAGHTPQSGRARRLLRKIRAGRGATLEASALVHLLDLADGFAVL